MDTSCILQRGITGDSRTRRRGVGTDNISIRVKMSEEGTVLNGTFKSDVKTPDGNVFFTTIGTYTATRILAEH